MAKTFIVILLFVLASVSVVAKVQLQADNVTTLSANNQDCGDTCSSDIVLCSDNTINNADVTNTLFANNIKMGVVTEDVYEQQVVDVGKGKLVLQPVLIGTKTPSLSVSKGNCQTFHLNVEKDSEVTSRWSWCIGSFCLDPWWVGTSTSLSLVPQGGTGFTTNNNITINDTSPANLTGSTNNITDWQIGQFNSNSLALFNIPMKAYKEGNVNRTDLDFEYLMDYDVNNNTFVQDTSGNNNHGVVIQGSSTGGFNQSGGWDGYGAYSFVNNTNEDVDYIEQGDSYVLFKTIPAYTVNLWFKDFNKDTSMAYTRHLWDCGSTYNDLYVQDSPTGKILRYKTVNSTINGQFADYSIINQYEWYMATAVYNRTLMQLYVNGELVNETTRNNDDLFANVKCAIGRHQSVNIGGWNGTIDDFRMWNRTLPQKEIKDLYDNYGANFTALDYSTNAYTLDLRNTTWNKTGGHDGLGGYEFTEKAGSGILVNNGAVIVNKENVNASMTVWVKTNSITDSTSRIIISANSNRYRLDQVNNIWRSSVVNDTSPYIIAQTSAVIGKWTFLSATYNGTNLTLYVNGVYVNSTIVQQNATPLFTSDLFFAIGKHPTLDGNNFNGSIDSAILWNRTLTAQQIWALYNNQTNILSSTELKEHEYYKACMTPYASLFEGQTRCTASVSINTPPTLWNVILNSTTGFNTTLDNYTMNFNYTSPENVTFKNLTTNWYINNKSLMLLNLPFEAETSNSTFTKDYSGFGNNGTVANATWNATGGYDGFGAYEFNGELSPDRTITIPYREDYNVSNFTVSFWINFKGNTSTTTIQEIWDGGVAGTGSAVGPVGWAATSLFAFGRIDFVTFNGTGLAKINTTVNLLTPNRWYFYTATRNGCVNTLYLNGLFIDNITQCGNVQQSGNDWVIGRRFNLLNFTVNGTIDDPIFWNRTLTPAQIYALNFSRTALLVGNETKAGDNISGCGLINDGQQDSNELCSQTIKIFDTTTPNITSSTCIPNPAEVNTLITCSINVTTTKKLTTSILNITWADGAKNGYTGINTSTGFAKTLTTSLAKGLANYTWLIIDSVGINSTTNGNFTVQDTTPPVITNLLPLNNTVIYYSPLLFSVDVTDNINVSTVIFNLSKPDGTTSLYTGVLSSGNTYTYNHTTVFFGTYSIFARATDVTGLNTTSSTNTFQFTANVGSWVAGIGILMAAIIISLAILFNKPKDNERTNIGNQMLTKAEEIGLER